jgi:hypothetical protein
MKKKETLKQKALRLWKAAGLPKFLNKYSPKKTPGWLTYLCYLEYTAHAPSWRRAMQFMHDLSSQAASLDGMAEGDCEMACQSLAIGASSQRFSTEPS